MKKAITVAAILLAAACTRQEAQRAGTTAKEKVQTAAQKVGDAFDVAVPIGGQDDPQAREKERFDEQWRNLEVFRQQQAQQAQQAAAQKRAQQAKVTFAPNGKETFKGIKPEMIQNAPVVVPIQGDVAGPSVLKTQVYLDRLDYSVGVLDGRWGRNSAIALWWYQRRNGLETTGVVDQKTFVALATDAGAPPAVVQHTLTADDVKGPFVSIPEDVYEKEKLDCLCYESKKEKLAEVFHTTPEFLDQLNPDTDFSAVDAGAVIWAPNVRPPMTSDRPDIAKIVVSLRGNTFNAYDAAGNLLMHAPTTVGSKYDPSPSEMTQVAKVTFDPHFHYQPTLFHEVPDSDPEAMLAPGPNSPVGVVWIALTKPHFGIHGTSDPDSIGYASSHGCIRLTNWDAQEVGHRVKPDVEVQFIDTRSKTAT